MIKVGKDNFQTEVLSSAKPVLVDFWADWCGPCRMLSPIVDEISEEYSQTAGFGKINVDEEPELAQQFGVSSIPTLILFKDGKEAARMVGVQPKEKIVEFIGG